MVDPDVGGELDPQGIAVRGEGVGDGDVADYDVCGGLDQSGISSVSS